MYVNRKRQDKPDKFNLTLNININFGLLKMSQHFVWIEESNKVFVEVKEVLSLTLILINMFIEDEAIV